MCKQSLTTLGHEITWRDSTADIEINFIQPENWHWTGPYRIGYLPWESTLFHPGWVEKMNNEVDEIWTPSPIIAQWMMDAGVTKEPKVYQHGVDDLWTPHKRVRGPDEEFKFLHIGAEALRKGGNDIIQSHIRTLWNEPAVLTLKMVLQQFGIIDSEHIKIIKEKIPIETLIALYHENHMMVYPSWGEGFGLTPLEAMATGMPVLITKGWAPYEYLLPPEMLIKSTLVDNPWQTIHPGKMFQPDPDDLDDKLRYFYDNLDQWTDFSFNLATQVHQDYDWLNLTRSAFSHLT